MGKGDKKTKRGKIWLGSFGVSRPKKVKNKKKIVRSPSLQGDPAETSQKEEKKN